RGRKLGHGARVGVSLAVSALTMKHDSRPRPARAALAAAVSLVLVSGGCLKTDLIATAFNGGALDNSSGDPFHDPIELRRDIARRLIKEEITDGFFGQSKDAPDG